uniref:Lymphotoxin-alpha-like n=1 Tax=Fundulus heteroclitus TaxID=8078 RepID=A0A3Q2Q2C0_FUNHE
MEMLAGSRDVFRQQKGRGMENDSCWRAREGGAETEAEAEAGLRCQNSLYIQLLKEKHRRRMAQFAAVVLLLLLGGVLALFLTFRLERPCASAPDSGTMVDADTHSSGTAEKMQQEDSAKQPPSAMLTVLSHNNTFGKYLLWEDKLGQAYIEGGFSYSNGSLVVPRKGLYRVFLQLTFRIQSGECSKNEVLTLSNSVNVFKNSYPIDHLLLSTVDTVVCGHRSWEKSLFTSGLFKLDAKDKLRVTSTHPSYLDRKEQTVFFGAELIF